MTRMRVLALVCLAIGFGCTASEKIGGLVALPVATVTVVPSTDTLTVGEQVTLTAFPKDQNGTAVTPTSTTWASSNDSVATVTQAGQVTAVASGAAAITVTADGVQGVAIIVVLAQGGGSSGSVASVSLVPPSATISVGGSVQVVATPKDSAGNVITGLTITWSAKNATASVTQSGLVTGVSVGVDTITATVGGQSADMVVTVQAVPIGTITLTPSSGTLDAAGATLQFIADVKDSLGNTVNGIQLTWTSSNTAIARVDSTGFLTTSFVPGNVIITAAAGGKAGTAQFNVVLRFRSISASRGLDGRHTCGVTLVRAAYCWGLNSEGQMGIGTQTSWNAPIATIGALAFTEIATGGFHSCAVTVTGSAYCWGRNTSGQLGTGNNTMQLIPTLVTGGLTFDTTSITAGLSHTCALTTAGAAYCWGAGAAGQIGNGGNGNHTAPAPVTGGHVFKQISAGEGHTCAVTNGGQAFCWGDNASGQLGTGDSAATNAPVLVSGGLSWTAISAGGVHSCGIATGGTMYCWGDNTLGQLATGNFATSPTPTPIFGGQAWSQVSAGPIGTCGVIAGAQTSGASAFCWGSNLFEQIGNGDTVQATKYTVPTAIQAPTAKISSRGDTHACVVTTNSLAYCWGRNDAGEMGIAVFSNVAPFALPLPTKVVGQP